MTDTATRPVLSVHGLKKSYSSRSDGYAVLDGISFDVHRGETLGVVGESGCGKSTLARAIMRLGDVTAGSITLGDEELTEAAGGRLRRLRHRFQMVFQDPFGSLDPRMTVLQLVEQPLAVHQLGDRTERHARAIEILSQLGLDESFHDRVPSRLSGGQRQRVAIARALVTRPELIVLDEPVSALDVSVQAQVLNLLREEQERLDLAYIFIVHDLSVAEYFCDRIVVLYLGRVVESGTAQELFSNPQHPYTVSLFSAAPDPRRAVSTDDSAPGRIVLHGEPQARRPEQGCPFASRCPVRHDRPLCVEKAPAPDAYSVDGHNAACHFPGELKAAGGRG
ncbi:MAG TPA: oligopeptide/dipeptide ABC transporter ATP-binding protein [Gryllotalpicola sp.]